MKDITVKESEHTWGGGGAGPTYQWSEPEFLILRSPRIDSKELISPAYKAWRAVTTTLFLLGS